LPENIAQRLSRSEEPVHADGFLLFGDFQALIETCTLRAFLVELDHACIDLLADGETVRRADRFAVTGELGGLMRW